MQSLAFIKAAGILISKINTNRHLIGTAVELHTQREAVQKEVAQLFAGLQNPTLPSAYRLRDTALRNGFLVDAKVQQNLAKYENISR
jgi:hypothetical protein